MYCIHYYLLPHIGALWILCMVVDCVCVKCVYERGISSFLCLHDFFCVSVLLFLIQDVFG